MMTINDILKYGESKLEDITPDYQIDARLILEEVLACDRVYLLLNKLEQVTDAQETAYKEMISKRASGQPLQYIVGHQDFMGLTFKVAPGVLIPRSDTEPLIEALIERMSGKEHFLDIGAGSGAIHISLLHYLKNASGVAVDISDQALEIASENAINLGVSDRLTYIKSDLFENIEEKFDVIVSNPPYIPTKDLEGLQKELSHEPKIALDGGNDGYDFYRAIIKEAPTYFNEKGLLAFEVGHDQARHIEMLLLDAGYQHIEIIKDLSQIERVVIARYERL
jgi:release factor glutamine methyltransferase